MDTNNTVIVSDIEQIINGLYLILSRVEIKCLPTGA